MCQLRAISRNRRRKIRAEEAALGQESVEVLLD